MNSSTLLLTRFSGSNKVVVLVSKIKYCYIASAKIVFFMIVIIILYYYFKITLLSRYI